MEGLISVIVPVYNADAFLDKCVGSVLGQSYRNFELILVNDGSRDTSLEICRRYEAADNRVKVIDKPNGGVSSARNAGLDAARGEWVVFCDADDYYLPDAFGVLIGLMALGSDIDFGAASSVKLEDGKVYELRNYTAGVLPHPIIRHHDYALWANIFRRSLIERLGLRFAEGISYSEDRLFMLEYLQACRKMAYSVAHVYVYRIHPDSACRTPDVVKMGRQQLHAAARILELEKRTDDPDARAVMRSASDAIVRMAVERAALSELNFKNLGELKDVLNSIRGLALPSRLPYWLFCLISRARGVRRALFPKRGRLLLRTDAEDKF